MAKYHDSIALSADSIVANLPAINIGKSGLLWLQCLIDNGAGAAPTDSPNGTWQLYFSANGDRYTRLTDSYIDAQLALIAAIGNNALVDGWARFSGAPGYAKVAWKNNGSVVGSSRATLWVTTP